MNASRCCWLLFGVVLATGCDGFPGSRTRAQAILKFNRAAIKGNASDFMIYRETQASLIRSNFVISAALRDQNVAKIKGISLPAVQNALNVQVGETEILSISLDQGTWSQQESKTILEAVLDGFMSEVVNQERLEKVDRLAKLRRRYQTAYQMVKKKSDEVTKLANETGSIDDENTATQIEIMKSKVSISMRS